MILSPSRSLVASVLGITGDIAHETLKLAVDVVDFVPVPGLAVAAKTLLNIRDTLQLVDPRSIISSLSLRPITDLNHSRPIVSHASASQNDVQISSSP